MHTLTRHRQSKRAQAQTEKGTGGTGGTDESVLLIHARARRRAGAGAQAGKQGSRQAADLFVQKRLRINIGKQLRRNVERQPSSAKGSRTNLRVNLALRSLRPVRQRNVGVARRTVLPTGAWSIITNINATRTPHCRVRICAPTRRSAWARAGRGKRRDM